LLCALPNTPLQLTRLGSVNSFFCSSVSLLY
jgi:hypothetical protein